MTSWYSWYVAALKKYADFSGRARRKEFWFYMLYNVSLTFVFLLLITMTARANNGNASGLTWLLTTLFVLYYLAVLVPSIAVSVRRLHDTNKSGWWLLAGVVPFVNLIGGIVLLVFYCLDGNPEANRFGPNPKGAEA